MHSAPSVAASLLFAVSEALGQSRGQSRFEDFLLRLGDIVIQAAQLDGLFGQVVDGVSGFGHAVSRLSHTADVHKVLAAGLDLELRIGSTAHKAVPNESHRDVGVPEETDAGVLISEARGGGQ